MIFENIKSITIPEGEVKRILYGSVVLWQKIISKIVNFIDTLVIQDGAERNIESLTQYGKCEQNATPTPFAPIDIKCNNGAIKVSANLLDPTTVPNENKYIVASNGDKATPGSGTFRHSNYIRIVGGEQYYFGMKPYAASTAGLAWYSTPNTGSYISGIHGTSLKNANMVATAPANANYVRFSWMINTGYDTDWQNSVYICVNGLMSAFRAFGEVYVDGTDEVLSVSDGVNTQTAGAENLLGLGNVTDEQNIISGEVTHKVGVKILDGTEEWETDTYGGNRRFVTRNFAKEQLSTVMCTHYSSTIEDGVRTAPNNAYVAATGALAIYRASTQSIDTVADWTAYLATQYANGTPVMMLYLLATETTEEVTLQPLYLVEGTNTISVSAEVSDIDFEIKYKAKVI